MSVWAKTIAGLLAIIFAASIIFSYVSVECVLTQRSGIRKIAYTNLCHPRWTISRQDFVRNYFQEDLVGKKNEYASEVLSKFGFQKSSDYRVNGKRRVSFYLREGHIGYYNTDWVIDLFVNDTGVVETVEVRKI